MRLMIVEDESITALFLKKTLQRLGHEVVSIHNCADTLMASLQQDPVDLIFMDIEIKGPIDGISAARDVRLLYNTPVIYVTSYKDSITMQEAMEAKPLGYVVKPVLESDIEAVIRVAASQVDIGTVPLHCPYRISDDGQILDDNNRPLKLTKKLRKIAALLLRNLGKVVSSEELARVAWGEPEELHIHKLRDLMYRLRRELPGVCITAHSQVGYLAKSKDD